MPLNGRKQDKKTWQKTRLSCKHFVNGNLKVIAFVLSADFENFDDFPNIFANVEILPANIFAEKFKQMKFV